MPGQARGSCGPQGGGGLAPGRNPWGIGGWAPAGEGGCWRVEDWAEAEDEDGGGPIC